MDPSAILHQRKTDLATQQAIEEAGIFAADCESDRASFDLIDDRPESLEHNENCAWALVFLDDGDRRGH